MHITEVGNEMVFKNRKRLISKSVNSNFIFNNMSDIDDTQMTFIQLDISLKILYPCMNNYENSEGIYKIDVFIIIKKILFSIVIQLFSKYLYFQPPQKKCSSEIGIDLNL
ncbi:hypothetical protein pb186bvf_021017, partial [Paramecium bursaria]